MDRTRETAVLINANSLGVPLKAKSVHMIACSPPYWGLRDYGNPDQLGQEELHDCLAWARGERPCGRCYVCAIRAVAAEGWRVLRDDGTFWLNLGDSYNGYPGNVTQGGKLSGKNQHARQHKPSGYGLAAKDLKQKDLAMIPARVALALQSDGWYVRQDIIWAKPNPMPESVTDRCTKSHEYIFLLTKSARYYYDHEAIKEGSTNSEETAARYRYEFWQNGKHQTGGYSTNGAKHTAGMKEFCGTRNRRSVWWVATKGYPGAHFAVWPPELVEPMIKAGSSEKGVCPECGAPWARVIHKGDPQPRQDNPNSVRPYEAASVTQANGKTTLHMTRTIKTVDWMPTCDCGCNETVPATVLDIFCGSGTTLQVARFLGRFGIGLDVSFDYLVNEAKTRLELDVLEAWEAGAGVQSSPVRKTAVKVPDNQMSLI